MSKLLKDTAFLLQGGNRGMQENCHGPKWVCELMVGRVVKIFFPTDTPCHLNQNS